MPGEAASSLQKTNVGNELAASPLFEMASVFVRLDHVKKEKKRSKLCCTLSVPAPYCVTYVLNLHREVSLLLGKGEYPKDHAHRDDGKRFVVRLGDKLMAYAEVPVAVRRTSGAHTDHILVWHQPHVDDLCKMASCD
ncbi:MAG: hypothetical protein WA269_03060 [Candidatus Udaeobacter sp.]